MYFDAWQLGNRSGEGSVLDSKLPMHSSLDNSIAMGPHACPAQVFEQECCFGGASNLLVCVDFGVLSADLLGAGQGMTS